ncbi:MAG: hypothetical protein ACRD9R_11255, partial [Pyrinomonadaceae bacterium]
RRLLDEASRYEARKYTAVAHKLLAQLAAERGDLAAAEDHLSAAIAQLHTHPVSVVEWKVYALLGRVRLRRDDPAGAHEAFGKSAAIVFQIAESVRDLKLRETFLDSSAAREVLAASGALALV